MFITIYAQNTQKLRKTQKGVCIEIPLEIFIFYTTSELMFAFKISKQKTSRKIFGSSG